jgi:hypothetical protein
MKIGINWNQQSTRRGAVWVFGGVVALIFLVLGQRDDAFAAIAMTGTIAGGLGLAVHD